MQNFISDYIKKDRQPPQHELAEIINGLQWLNKIRFSIALVFFILTLFTGAFFLFSSTKIDSFLFLNKNSILFLLAAESFELLLNRPFSFILNKIKNYKLFGMMQALADIFIITLCVHFAGGIEFPLSIAIYSFAIIFSSVIMQNKLSGYICAAVSSIMYAFIILGEYSGFITHYTTSGWQPDFHMQLFIIIINLLIFFLMANCGADTAAMIERKKKSLDNLFNELKKSSHEKNRFFTNLKKSDEAFRNLVDSTNDLICSITLDGVIISVNKAGSELLGYHKKELEGSSLLKYIPTENIHLAEDMIVGAEKRKEKFRNTFKIKNKAGKIIYLEAQWHFFDKHEGRPEVQVIARDITKRIEAEKKLQRKIKLESAVAKVASSLIAEKNIDNGINRALRILGEVVGADRSYIFKIYDNGKKADNTHEWCADGIEPQIENLAGMNLEAYPWFQKKMRNNEVIAISDSKSMSSGETKDLITAQEIQAMLIVPIFSGKTLTGFIGFDSTRGTKEWENSVEKMLIVASATINSFMQRKKAEHYFIENQRMLQLIYKNSHIGMAFLDKSLSTKTINPVMAEILGYKQNEIDKKPFKEIFRENTLPVEVLEDVLNNRLKFKDERFKAYIKNRSDRQPGYYNIHIAPLFDDNNDVTNIVLFVMDITNLVNAQEDKLKIETQLRHSQKMEAVGVLAGGIAHDFNNILQAISGYVQLIMLSKEEDHPDYKYLNQIETSAQRAADLVKQILIFSRKVESKLTPLNLNNEVENVNKILRRILPKMIEVKLDLTDETPVINADAAQLQQIMMNLAVNAKDVMPDGGELVFKTEIIYVDKNQFYGESEINPGQYVLLTVSDTGTGMDDKTIEHIFEPFFTTKGVGKGTGLGLSMAYGIVQNHGGFITCTSRIGKGTKFKIYFPCNKIVELTEYAGEATNTDSEKINEVNETILLVDDEKPILDIADKMLKKYGYKTLTANCGETAIEIYKENIKLIDMVILDLGMPGMGGYKCLPLLLDLNPELKVLVASGYATKDINKVLKLGAAGFISKPYMIDAMTKKIRNILESDAVL